jgi:exodeoxyribonuclease VII small subunit
MPTKPKSQDSFSTNFNILQQAVDRLQDSEGISVDELLPLVDKATEAYNQCKKRLQLVENALEKRFQDNQSNNEKNIE